ncbi:hypothetical protein AKJ16_DCAP01404, partial [Drosera capensis]
EQRLLMKSSESVHMTTQEKAKEQAFIPEKWAQLKPSRIRSPAPKPSKQQSCRWRDVVGRKTRRNQNPVDMDIRHGVLLGNSVRTRLKDMERIMNAEHRGDAAADSTVVIADDLDSTNEVES